MHHELIVILLTHWTSDFFISLEITIDYLLNVDALKQGEQLILPKGLLLVAHEPSFVNTAPGPHIRGNTLRAYSIGDKEADLLLPGTAR